MKRCLHMELSIISNNWLEDRTDRIGTYLSIRLVMWPGARPFSALYVVNKILTWQSIVWWGASADYSIKILGIMCSNFLLLNTSQYFLHLPKRFFPPSWSAHTWRKNNQCVAWRGKDTFLVCELLRQKDQKNSAKYLKANTNTVYCMINVTIQCFHRDENILMQSALVVC